MTRTHLTLRWFLVAPFTSLLRAEHQIRTTTKLTDEVKKLSSQRQHQMAELNRLRDAIAESKVYRDLLEDMIPEADRIRRAEERNAKQHKKLREQMVTRMSFADGEHSNDGWKIFARCSEQVDCRRFATNPNDINGAVEDGTRSSLAPLVLTTKYIHGIASLLYTQDKKFLQLPND